MINTATGTIDSYVYPEYANATYDNDSNPATPEVPWPDTYKRYATAVRRIDDAVGDIRKLLEDLKIDDNTLVVFTSDNGPSIESYLPAGFAPNSPTFFGNYGPFDGIKRDCWEGGLRMPTLTVWPGHISPDKVIAQPSMLSDWMPTFANAAQIQVPARSDGVSLLPVLTGKGKQQQGLVYVEYFEGGKTPNFKEFEASRRGVKRGEMQAIRIGDLMGVRYQIRTADDDFEIYNVVTDPKETQNLALKPGLGKIQAQMKAKVLQARQVDKEAPRPYDGAAIPPDDVAGDMVAGANWSFYQGDFPWVVSESGLTANAKGIAQTISGIEAGSKQGLICYEGYVKVLADGVYTFGLKAAGKAYVRLHEATLIDEDYGYKRNSLITQTVNLKAGFHAVKVYYLPVAGSTAQLQFSWKMDGVGKAETGVELYRVNLP